MKVKKLENVLFYLSFVSMLLAFLLFIISPFVDGKGFEYVGLDAFVAGFFHLFSFKFDEAPFVLFFALYAIAVFCLIVWAIGLIARKARKANIVRIFFSIISVTVLFSLACAVFAATVTFNGKETTLFEGMSQIVGHEIGKGITIGSISLAYFSLITNTLFAFSTIFEVTNPVKIVTIVEKPAEQTAVVHEVITEETDDERKKREEEFIQQCVDSGEFTVYEEWEFEKPLKGLTKEPVVEEVVVEETTEIHTNFDPRKNRKVTIK